jgi:hypothetical protein
VGENGDPWPVLDQLFKQPAAILPPAPLFGRGRSPAA